MIRIFAIALMALGGLLLASAGPAVADPIGPTCGTCQGATYQLTYSGSAEPDADPLHETFRISLIIDTSGYSGGGSFIHDVAIKVTANFDAGESASLFSAPSGSWALDGVNSGIDASGCSGSGGGFVCAEHSGSGESVPNGTYTWIFDITIDNGTLFTGLLESSVKARYVDASGAKVGDLVSENITLQVELPPLPPIPAPATVILLGLGVLGLGVGVRLRGR
ncbi:MAG TPA: hypothetical protein VFN71_05580 [Methylomirabilota bacterium]|nr:hypothetical protein [Methylomirabilota bacterium]